MRLSPELSPDQNVEPPELSEKDEAAQADELALSQEETKQLPFDTNLKVCYAADRCPEAYEHTYFVLPGISLSFASLHFAAQASTRQGPTQTAGTQAP